MQSAAGHGGLDDLLCRQREEERHADLVDDKRNPLCEREVAFGGAVGPDESGRHAEGKQEKAVEQVIVQAMAEPRGSPPLHVEVHGVLHTWRRCLPPHDGPTVLVGCRRMTPESTVRPVRDTAWKDSSSPAISTSMKDWSWSKYAAVAADGLTSPFASSPAAPE